MTPIQHAACAAPTLEAEFQRCLLAHGHYTRADVRRIMGIYRTATSAAGGAKGDMVPLGYFVYHDEGGYEPCKTEQEAREAAEELLKGDRKEAEFDMKWPDCTDSTCWGVVLGKAVKCSEEGEACDYELIGPVAALAAQSPDNGAGRVLGNVKPDNATTVHFYEQDFYVLSNFSAFTLLWHGLRFDTSEAAYHFEKFKVGEGCAPIRAAILSAPSAHQAFKIAERHKDKRRPDWDQVKVQIMRSILRAKVDQHEYVRRKLLATGERELVEDSWRDPFWGWGPNRDGQNMLGKLWMEIRAELRAQTLEGGA